ncbi:MAG: rhomboid family intramembrane serine protease, partial [Halobacteriota archaeon]
LTAAFSHASAGHVVGNLVGTLTLGTLVEYAWGHYPRARGDTSFGRVEHNPYVRAFVFFPVAAVVVGLLTSLFSIGPVIGFSGVVFAFAGFALVYYPLTTLLALFVGRAVRTVHTALVDPTTTATAKPVFSTPWWADVAIQGHALGLFIGVLVGTWLLRLRNDDPPSAFRLWGAVVMFGIAQSLWAVYWFRGAETFVLYRAVGVTLVVILATLVALTVTGSTQRAIRNRLPTGLTELRTVTGWQAGFVVLLLGMSAISGPAIPINLVTTNGDDLPNNAITVRDYQVTYVEDVPNGMVSAFDVDAFGESTNLNTSGVVVQSNERRIWTTDVTKGRLAFDGHAMVRLGGLGWRDQVYVEREGWNVVGGGTAYRVNLTHAGETRTAFTSQPMKAEPVVAGRNISIATHESDFVVAVSHNETLVTSSLPEINESVTLEQVTFQREEDKLYATYDSTRVRVAKKESYEH